MGWAPRLPNSERGEKTSGAKAPSENSNPKKTEPLVYVKMANQNNGLQCVIVSKALT
jgi:hypothetical protein